MKWSRVYNHTTTILAANFYLIVYLPCFSPGRIKHRTTYTNTQPSSNLPLHRCTQTASRKMHFKHHDTSTASDIMTTKIVLVVFFVFIIFTIAAYFVANWLINRNMELHERTLHQDIEACQPLLNEQFHSHYATFSSASHAAPCQDLETRRIQRRERIRDHISGVHQISVSRLDDEVSVSSDDSNADSSVEETSHGADLLGREHKEDSSESESDSSDDSDSDSDEVMEMRGLVSMARSLPRRVALLREDVGRVVD